MPIWSREAFVSGLALSLLHSLWQGALLGGVGLILNARLQHAAPAARCSVFYILLLTFGAAWLGTFLALYAQAAHPAVSTSALLRTQIYLGITPTASVRPASSGLMALLPSLAPCVVVAWALGVCLLSLRHLGGLLLLQRWCKRESAPCLPVWEACAQRLATQMGIGRKILLRCSAQIDVPFAFGIFKSYILLPSSVLMGVSPEQAEALIAHELAHIARFDVLFNLVQVCVETILFYHPAVWWLSAQIRVAREQRCDDLAVQVIGDRALYARALYSLEEARAVTPHLALGAKGDHSRMTNRHLIHRIQRVLGVSGPEKRDPWAKGALALCAAAIGLSTLIPVRAYSRPAQQDPPAKQEKIVKVVTDILLNINGDKIELHTTDLKPDTLVTVNGKEGRYGDLNATQQKQLAEALQNVKVKATKHRVNVNVDKDGDGSSVSVIAGATKVMLNINGDKIELNTTDLKPDTLVKVNGKESKFKDLNATQQKQLQEAIKAVPAGDVRHMLKLRQMHGDGTSVTVTNGNTTHVVLKINGDKIELNTTDLKPDTLVKVNGKESRFGDLNATQQKQLQDAVGNIHIVVSPDGADVEGALNGLNLPDDIKNEIIEKVKKELPPPPPNNP